MLFRVARSRDGGAVSHYDLYKVDVKKGMTVLDALFQIQDKMDPSLSFRYSCRGAVCGSCAMLINKEPRLACKIQVSDLNDLKMNLKPFPAITDVPPGWNPNQEVLVEPLPNLPILKDLIVDMTRFYNALESLKLWAEPAEGKEARTQSPSDRKRVERKEEYVGPSALAKAWRFHEDSRTSDKERYFKAATTPEGAPLCDLIMNCVKACPKGVAPGGAIRKIKKAS